MLTIMVCFLSPIAWADITIDNADQEFQTVGSGWSSYSNPPWTSAYGDDFQANITGDGTRQAIFTFNITEANYYEIYGWWMSHQYCSQDTPYSIFFSDGNVVTRVNQQQNSGQWNLLATGFFEQGEHQIIISDDASGVVVIADAIRIVAAPSAF